MVNVFTDTSSNQGTALIKTAYDKALEWELRSEPMFRTFATKRPELPTHNSNTVVLTIEQDVAVSSAPSALSETADDDAQQGPAVVNVTVTFAEYGYHQIATLKLRRSTFVSVDPIVSKQVSNHLVDSIDLAVRAKLDTLTNVLYVGTSNSFTTNNTGGALTDVTGNLNIAAVRAARQKMVKRNAMRWEGNDFMAVADPDVTADLMAETGPGSWNDVHTYSGQVQSIYAGEVGKMFGVRFIESPRCRQNENNGASETVYSSYLMGRDALVQLTEIEPGIVVGGAIGSDVYKRFLAVGWYGEIGWAKYREECGQLIKSTSSLAGF